eukprot:c17498_g1_i1.p1 GENE.c17498_g1_i1~~c17498_g1_i1.p1  ORF type:complete len:514 (-),score=124.16 c17498_g1_i1:105-1646(-)
MLTSTISTRVSTLVRNATLVRVATMTTRAKAIGVNQFYECNNQSSFPEFKPHDNSLGKLDKAKHNKAEWTQPEIDQAIRDHSMYTWGASIPMFEATVPIDRTENIYMYEKSGKRYIDWSSGAVCSNLGHTMPESIKQAVIAQMNKNPFTYGDMVYHEPRARLCSLLAEVCPGDLNSFIFASGGAEAVECAIRMARLFTGRQKIISRYRSYHGATSGSLSTTGDFRRWAVDGTTTGFVKAMDPFPFHFRWGETEAVATKRCLDALHEQIISEGSNSVAAIVLEPITGTNGWLVPPTEFLQGVRALCDKYGILLVCDEVMSGFGRTGQMFGFQNFPGVVPDLFTFAKGVTAAYLPLSGVGMRANIFEHFKTNPIGYGSTYSAHPLPVIAGYETVKYLIENDIAGHAKRMEPVMIEELSKLVQKHPSVKQARCMGLASGFDLQDKHGNFIVPMHGANDGTALFKKKLREYGLITMVRGHFVHCTPPLIITPDQIREGFSIISKALDPLDEFIAKQP